jgi:hypothetical protein
MAKIAAGVSALVAVIVMIVLLVSGRNSDDPAPASSPQVQATETVSPTPTGSPPPIVTLASTTVVVRLDENRITAAKRSIRPTHGTITLALVNESATPLSFVLARGKPKGAAAISTARVAEFPLKAAEVQTDQVGVSRGDYTLIVRTGDNAAAAGTTSLRVR